MEHRLQSLNRPVEAACCIPSLSLIELPLHLAHARFELADQRTKGLDVVRRGDAHLPVGTSEMAKIAESVELERAVVLGRISFVGGRCDRLLGFAAANI